MGEKPAVTYDDYMAVMQEIQKITTEDNYAALEKILRNAWMADKKWKKDFKDLAESAGVNINDASLDYLWDVLLHFYAVAVKEGVPWLV